MPMVVTNNSPSAGYIAWTGVSISYKGAVYNIANGNTNLIYVYWKYSDPTSFYGSNTFPVLGNDDLLVFLNKSGVHVKVPTATVVDGSLIVPESIVANAIASNAITTDKLSANAITAEKIAVGAVGASAIATGVISADKLVSTSPNMMEGGLDMLDQVGTLFGTTAGFSSIALSTEQALVGLRSIKTVNLATAGSPYKYLHPTANVSTGWIPVVVGLRYTLSCYVKTITTGSVNVQLVGVWKTSAGADNGTFTYNGTITTADDWARIYASAIAPANSVSLTLYIRSTTNSATIYWDGFQAEQQPATSNGFPSAWRTAGVSIINGSNIITRTITADRLATNTITATSGVIANLAVTTAMIADVAITSAKIANLAVGTAQIADSAITNAKIANASIDSAKISSLDAGKITTGTLSAITISGVTISGSQFNTTGTEGTVTIENDRISTVSASGNYTSEMFGGITTWRDGGSNTSGAHPTGLYASSGTSDYVNVSPSYLGGFNFGDAMTGMHLGMMRVGGDLHLYNNGYGYITTNVQMFVGGTITSNTGTITAIHPSQDSSLSLSWATGDVARIRVGGTGSGSINGFAIDGVGDDRKFLVSNDGAGWFKAGVQLNGDLRIANTYALTFNTYGGGFHMNDTTWVRITGSKSLYAGTGIIRTDGRLEVGASGSQWAVNSSGDSSQAGVHTMDNNKAIQHKDTSGATKRSLVRGSDNLLHLNPDGIAYTKATGRFEAESYETTWIGGTPFIDFTRVSGHDYDGRIMLNSDDSIGFNYYGQGLKHRFYNNGTKSGGSIEINGKNLGMSPIDSPQVLFETIEFDVLLEDDADGVKVLLNKDFADSVGGRFAVFPNNGTVIEKGYDYFLIKGVGLADIRIVGERIGYEDVYYDDMNAGLVEVDRTIVEEVGSWETTTDADTGSAEVSA